MSSICTPLSSSGVQIEHEDEDHAATEGAGVGAQKGEPDANIGAGTRDRNQGDKILSMSPFERFMNFDHKFQSMNARFRNLDEQIDIVQNQLFKLQYGKDD
ncbi:hypothetical protein VNO80_27091 [Phaseolus coccineus]|uniref:Uncharacterized protein n=1 Tax=Phaseolus coccineus TaxID=3886 RepID=A0AAN9QL26_PHACN